MSFLLGGVKKLIWGQGDGQPAEEPDASSPARPSQAGHVPASPSPSVSTALPASPESVVIGEVLSEAAITLFRFDRTKNVYEEKGHFTLKLIEKGEFQFELHVFVGARSMMKHSLSNEENTQFDKPKHAMMWISVLNNVVQYWKAVFLNHEQEAAFKDKVKRSLVESNRKEKFDDIYKPDEQDYVMSALEPEIEETPDESTDDDGGMDYEDEFSDEDEEDAKMVSSFQTPMRRGKPLKAPAPPSSSTKKYQRISETDLGTRGQAEKNDNLAVGLANNRTFVLRGAKVGVFKHNEDDELKYVTKIPEITTLDGDILRPDKVMLHQADHKMLLLNSDNAFKDKVFCMDLERGQVIEEWAANEGQAIRNFGPVEKYAQLTDDPTLVGVSHNGIFTLDPRISGKTKLAASKFYAAKPMMACVTSNDNGQVATGSLTGEIRLFNDITKNAKTLLPGLGDAILGMDSTADGKWLLATTAKYLLVIPTEKPDDAKGRTGFDVSLGKDKPIPLKLTIHPTDLASYNITEVNFTPAKFNIGDGVSEDWIVASTGPFLVIWNFKKIKEKKDIYAYKIQWCPQTVVADQFRFNKDDQVVVTLAQDVFLQSRKPRV